MRSHVAATFRAVLLFSLAVVYSTSALAQEITNYTYDELGRLKQVTRFGGPVNGVVTTYQHDKASNSTNVKVENSTNGTDPGMGGASAATQGLVVVPLNGYSVIFYVR